MKKILNLSTLLILLAMIGILAACGNTTSSKGESSSSTSNSSESSEKKVLRVGATGQSFPNSYKEGEELVGFDVEVFETIAKNLGYDVEWTLASFDGLVGQLETGKIDTIANAFEYTDERAEKLNYSNFYSYTSTGIAVQKDSSYQTVKDLEGQSVAGVLGSNKITVLENYVKENGLDIEVKQYETRDGPQLDTIKGTIAGYVQGKSILQATIKKSDLPLRILEDDLKNSEIGFPFVKTEDGDKLREAFNTEIEKLREDGTLAEISDKYYGEDITVEK